MNDIALPPEVARQMHTELGESSETENVVAQDQPQQPTADMSNQPAVDMPQNPVADMPQREIPDHVDAMPDLRLHIIPTGGPLYQMGPAPNAAPTVIVPPVNVSIPPEVLAVFTAQMQSALDSVAQMLVGNVDKTAQAVLDNLPEQEAQAVKKNPWLIPALDIAVGVFALASLGFLLVAAVTFGNPLAKQYIGAAGMVVLALMNRSPISPPATPQNVQKVG